MGIANNGWSGLAKNAPDVDRIVVRTPRTSPQGQELAIARESQRGVVDRACIKLKGSFLTACCGIPNSNERIEVARGGEGQAVWRKRNSPDDFLVGLEADAFSARRQVPKLNQATLAADCSVEPSGE